VIQKILNLSIVGLLILIGMLCGCGGEEKTEPASITATTPEINLRIKFEATTYTWREGQQPYDIYTAIKQKLEQAGFEVVPEEVTYYDATLFIDYTENKGSGYSLTGFGQTMAYGTNIKCDLRLEDKTRGLIFEKTIYASTPSESSALYVDAVADFEDEVYFKYMGDVIACIFCEGSEVSVLILALADEDYGTQEDAIWALGEIGETAVEPLIQALQDEDEGVRYGAAEALGEIGDVRAVEPLIQGLQDEGEGVRKSVVVALRKMGDTRAVEPIIQTLQDEDSDVRLVAVIALGVIGDDRAVEPLIQALQDEDEGVRAEAAEALGEMEDSRAVEGLIQALNDESYWVRYRATEALGEIGDARAIEPLVQALQDEDDWVREAAQEALEKIREKQSKQ